MAYGMNFRKNFRRAAVYVDKLRKGANPADLPMEQPMHFKLVLNLKDRPGAWDHAPPIAPRPGG